MDGRRNHRLCNKAVFSNSFGVGSTDGAYNYTKSKVSHTVGVKNMKLLEGSKDG